MSNEFDRLLLIQYNQVHFSTKIEDKLLSMMKLIKSNLFERRLNDYKKLEKELMKEYE